ncbi:TPA: hypothetical protein RQN23_002905 [Aeromonas veronii]|nr:hypothetical protein [Aeromonas veronii]
MEDVLQSERLFQLVRSQATFQQKGLQLQEALQKRTADLAALQAEAKERFGTDDPAQLSAIAERMRLWVQEVIKFDARAHKVVDTCLNALKEGVPIAKDTLHELSNLAQIQHVLMEAASNNSFDVVVPSAKADETHKPSSVCDPAFQVDISKQDARSTIQTSEQSAQAVNEERQVTTDSTATAAIESPPPVAENEVVQPPAVRRNNVLRSAQLGLRPIQNADSSSSAEGLPAASQDPNQSKSVSAEPTVNPLLVSTGQAVIQDGQLIAAGNGPASKSTADNSAQDIKSSAPDQIPESTEPVVRRPPMGGVKRKL